MKMELDDKVKKEHFDYRSRLEELIGIGSAMIGSVVGITASTTAAFSLGYFPIDYFADYIKLNQEVGNVLSVGMGIAAIYKARGAIMVGTFAGATIGAVMPMAIYSTPGKIVEKYKGWRKKH